MAVSVSTVHTNYEGARKVATVDITFDASYPTGGEALTPATLGFVTLTRVDIDPGDGYVFEYDYANEKVLAYWVDTSTDGAPLAQVGNTTDLSSVVARAAVTGT